MPGRLTFEKSQKKSVVKGLKGREQKMSVKSKKSYNFENILESLFGSDQYKKDFHDF